MLHDGNILGHIQADVQYAQMGLFEPCTRNAGALLLHSKGAHDRHIGGTKRIQISTFP
jgi:hypothetical protein